LERSARLSARRENPKTRCKGGAKAMSEAKALVLLILLALIYLSFVAYWIVNDTV
jgi:hypothetical protein